MASINVTRCQGLHLQKLLNKFYCVFSSASISVGGLATSCSVREQFQMPERIHRSPTDILKALDSTISRDKSGPHYRYHDDPYLTPLSGLDKRIFSLSKESGRKAAEFIKSNNPELFDNMSDDPVIKAFQPIEQFTEGSEVTEDTLQELILCQRVTHAVTVYNICINRQISVSPVIQQSLLELLCYYNEEDPPNEDYMEERSLSRRLRPGKEATNTWKNEGLAEVLFEQLEEPSAAAYNVLIRGLARHNNVEGAWQRYEEAVAADLPLDTATYNELIASAALRHDGYDERWRIVVDLLTAMASRGLRPDLGTLNNGLLVLYLSAGSAAAKTYSLQLLREMNGQGVRPSLASYFFLLTIHCRDRGPKSGILYSILDELEKEEGDIPLRDMRDTFFFLQAMDVCRKHLQNMDAAHRLLALVERGRNVRLLGENYKETVFYRNYVLLAVSTLPLPEFMEIYNEIVPHVYSVETEVVQSIINAVVVQGCFQYLPTLSTDIFAMNMFNDTCVGSLLSAMVEYVPDDTDETVFGVSSSSESESGQDAATKKTPTCDDKKLRKRGAGVTYNEFSDNVVTLREQMSNIVAHFVSNIKELTDERTKKKVNWSGHFVGQMLQVLSACGGSHIGHELLQVLLAHPRFILGEVPPSPLHKFCQMAMKENNADAALISAVYCNEFHPVEAKVIGKDVASMDALQAQHRAKLAIVFGNSILLKTASAD